MLLKAFENIKVKHPKAVMILAPRGIPERFQTVAGIIQQMGIPFHSALSLEPPSRWRASSIGVGRALIADVAFVGGSLVLAADTTSSSPRSTELPW